MGTEGTHQRGLFFGSGNRAQTPGWETESHLTPSTRPSSLTPRAGLSQGGFYVVHKTTIPPHASSAASSSLDLLQAFKGMARLLPGLPLSCLFLSGGKEDRERERRIRVGTPPAVSPLAGFLEQLIEALHSSIFFIRVVNFLNNLPKTSDLFIAGVFMFSRASSIPGIDLEAFV